MNDFWYTGHEIKKPEPLPGRIKRFFDSIKQLAPEVARNCFGGEDRRTDQGVTRDLAQVGRRGPTAKEIGTDGGRT